MMKIINTNKYNLQSMDRFIFIDDWAFLIHGYKKR